VDKIVISGISGYDGEYDLDATYFTNKELHTIKRLAGVRAGEIGAAFAAGDNDLLIALTVIALERAGKAVFEDALWNAKVGCIEMVADTPVEEADADPPATGSGGNVSESSASSGPTSNDGSAPQENGQSRTGLQSSELSAA
jgi:hypothetical protein